MEDTIKTTLTASTSLGMLKEAVTLARPELVRYLIDTYAYRDASRAGALIYCAGNNRLDNFNLLLTHNGSIRINNHTLIKILSRYVRDERQDLCMLVLKHTSANPNCV